MFVPSPSVHSLPEAQWTLGFICHRVGCHCLSGIDDTFKMKNVTTLRLVWGGDRHAGTRTCVQLGPHGGVQRKDRGVHKTRQPDRRSVREQAAFPVLKISSFSLKHFKLSSHSKRKAFYY